MLSVGIRVPALQVRTGQHIHLFIYLFFDGVSRPREIIPSCQSVSVMISNASTLVEKRLRYDGLSSLGRMCHSAFIDYTLLWKKKKAFFDYIL